MHPYHHKLQHYCRPLLWGPTFGWRLEDWYESLPGVGCRRHRLQIILLLVLLIIEMIQYTCGTRNGMVHGKSQRPTVRAGQEVAKEMIFNSGLRGIFYFRYVAGIKLLIVYTRKPSSSRPRRKGNEG